MLLSLRAVAKALTLACSLPPPATTKWIFGWLASCSAACRIVSEDDTGCELTLILRTDSLPVAAQNGDFRAAHVSKPVMSLWDIGCDENDTRGVIFDGAVSRSAQLERLFLTLAKRIARTRNITRADNGRRKYEGA
jgi:hypothetical protein